MAISIHPNKRQTEVRMHLADDDVVTVTRTVFTTMLDMNVVPCEPRSSEAPLEPITGCVHISGAWRGAIVLKTSLGLARRAACQMLRLRPDETAPADQQDALAEIANMVGGNIKSLVTGPSTLSLPSVTTGEDFDFRVSGARIVCLVPMVCEGEPIDLLVFEQDHAFESEQVEQQPPMVCNV